MQRLITLVAFVGLVFTVGCFDRQAALVGTWQGASGGGGTIEFFRDGTVNVAGSMFGVPVSTAGKYKLLDDDRISLEFSGLFGLGGASVFKVNVSGNELTLTDSAGNSQRFRKR